MLYSLFWSNIDYLYHLLDRVPKRWLANDYVRKKCNCQVHADQKVVYATQGPDHEPLEAIFLLDEPEEFLNPPPEAVCLQCPCNPVLVGTVNVCYVCPWLGFTSKRFEGHPYPAWEIFVPGFYRRGLRKPFQAITILVIEAVPALVLFGNLESIHFAHPGLVYPPLPGPDYVEMPAAIDIVCVDTAVIATIEAACTPECLPYFWDYRAEVAPGLVAYRLVPDAQRRIDVGYQWYHEVLLRQRDYASDRPPLFPRLAFLASIMDYV